MKRHHVLSGIIVSIGMAFLIFDSKTSLSGASEGIELCLRTVIPALFPFFILSAMLTDRLIGTQIPGLSFLGLPRGGESIFLVGLLAGYPVGAQIIHQAWQNGLIQTKDARRMLGFCSNAGPAFLFGITGILFDRWYIAWILWAIHILSAVLAASILPGKSTQTITIPHGSGLSAPEAVSRSVKIMAQVCAWVVIFRVIIAFSSRWFLWLLPETGQLLYAGLLELSNGCIALSSLPSHGMRFILCAAYLGFGGLCVAMQTVSVTGKLGNGMYFPGKLLQGSFSILISAAVQNFLFQPSQHAEIPVMLLCLILMIIPITVVWIRKNKNNSSNTVFSGV